MDDNKITQLKELKGLLKSGSISQNEFAIMKKQILESSDISNPESVFVAPKKSHKVRNIIFIIVTLLAVIGGGSATYIIKNHNDNIKQKNKSPEKKKKNTKEKKSSNKNNESYSSKTADKTQQVTSSTQNNDSQQLFNNLDQTIQLGAMYSFAVQKAGSYDSYWTEANVVNADLNSANTIVLYPTHGNTDIVFVDKHNGDFEYTINNSGTVESSGVVTSSELYEISQKDTQVRTWASEIEMK